MAYVRDNRTPSLDPYPVEVFRGSPLLVRETDRTFYSSVIRASIHFHYPR